MTGRLIGRVVPIEFPERIKSRDGASGYACVTATVHHHQLGRSKWIDTAPISLVQGAMIEERINATATQHQEADDGAAPHIATLISFVSLSGKPPLVFNGN